MQKSMQGEQFRSAGRAKSPPHSHISTVSRNLNNNVEKEYKNRPDTRSSHHRLESENEDYARLESEVLNLKKSIVDRLQKKDAQTSKGQIKFKDLESDNSSDEDVNTRVENKPMGEWNSSVIPRDMKASNKSLVGTNKSFYKNTGGADDREDYKNYSKPEKGDKHKAEKSLSKLKSTLKEREKVQQDSYINLKSKCRELQNVLREYVSKVYNLEESIRQKEDQIRDYEEQVSRTQEDLIRSEEDLEEYKRIEENLRKNEAEIKSANMDYKLKTSQQEDRIEELDQELRLSRERHGRELEELLEENDKLKVEFEVLKDKMAELKKNNEKLEKEEQNLREEVERNKANMGKLEASQGEKDRELKSLSGDAEKLRTEKGILEAKLAELKETLKQNNEKTINDERKHSEEMRALKEEKEKKIAEKKEKIKNLKAQIAETEELAQRVLDEKKFAAEEKDRVFRQRENIERDYIRSRDEAKLMREEM